MKKLFSFTILLTLLTIKAHAEQNALWFSYGDAATKRTQLGYETKETYDMAAYYPAKFEGLTISAVRFYIRNTACIKDLKVWLATELPAAKDASDADIEVINLDLKTIKGGDEGDYAVGMPNEVNLTSPYTITSRGVYVGYSFTVTSTDVVGGQQPMVRFMDTRNEHGFYYRTSDNMPNWTLTPEPFGDLALHILLNGDFATSAVSPTDIPDAYVMKGGSVKVKTTLRNNGFDAVSSIRYAVTSGAKTYNAVTVPVSGLASYGATTTLSFEVPADTEAGNSTLSLTILDVNGKPNNAEKTTATGRLCTVDRLFTRRVAVEECTGTGCMWCPRGHVGMEMMRDALGDRFVGIAIHQFNNTDPMYIDESRYYPHAFSGAPFCHLNRRGEIDPYYGTQWTSDHTILQDVAPLLDEIAKVGVEVTGTWNDDKTAVNATATVEALLGECEYDVEYVLIADDLHSKTRTWNQKNGYYNSSAKDEPEPLRQFCRGGSNGSAAISDWHYNDVCLSSSYQSYQNQAAPIYLPAAYTPVTNTYTIGMTTSRDVLAVLDYTKVYIVALVVDKSSYQIVNAAKARVTEPSASGISNHTATNTTTTPVTTFSLDGKALSHPTPGLHLVRYTDGTVRKVIF